jgi:hypothetical protein
MDGTEPTPNDWWVKGVLTVIATLSTIVAFFYRKLESTNAKAIEDLQKNLVKQEVRSDDCEKNRLELYKTQILQQVEITALKQEINNLKSRTA